MDSAVFADCLMGCAESKIVSSSSAYRHSGCFVYGLYGGCIPVLLINGVCRYFHGFPLYAAERGNRSVDEFENAES